MNTKSIRDTSAQPFFLFARLSLAFVLALTVAFPVSCFAQSAGTSQTPPANQAGTSQSSTMTYTSLQNPLKVSSVGGLISTFVQIFSYLVILLAVLMLIWTGFQYILARGNPEEMKKQTARLGYIMIGIAVVIGARVIITVIINTLQASGTVSPQVIQSAQNAVNGN